MDAPLDMAAERAAREIMAYFHTNPEAADSVAGVTLWLERGGFHRPPGVIERALNILVERGQVSCHEPVAGGSAIYHVRRSSHPD